MIVSSPAVRGGGSRLWRPLRFAHQRSFRIRTPAAGAVDALLASELQQFHVEDSEPNAMVEVAQVREFVAQSARQTGIAQWSSGDSVAKPDPDHTIFITDAVPALHVGALGLDRPVTETEPPGNLLRVSVEERDQTSRY